MAACDAVEIWVCCKISQQRKSTYDGISEHNREAVLTFIIQRSDLSKSADVCKA